MAGTLSRRKLLALAGAGLSGLAAPARACRASGRWDEAWDVIVVGSGAAGLSAAIMARKAGASVLLIEKNRVLGGNTALCIGDMAVCGSPIQKKLGIRDSPEIMAADIRRYGVTSDFSRCLFVSHHSLAAWKWTVDELRMNWADNAVQFDVGQSRPRGIMMKPRTGASLISAAVNRAEFLKVALRPGCRMESILRRRDRGAPAEGLCVSFEGGPLRRIQARSGIVLAFGGFGADVRFREALDPTLGSWVQTTNQLGATGESVTAAQKAGCAVVDMAQIQSLPFLCADEIGLGSAWSFIEYVTASRAIWVDDRGERFVNEQAGHSERSRKMLALARAGHRLYGIADQRAFDAPIPNFIGTKNWDEMVKRGIVRQYKTLSELCQDSDIPEKRLVHTIEVFNSFVRGAGGRDAFGRTLSGCRPLATAPWYLVEIQAKVHHCMGGLRIRPGGEVLDVRGEVIPRLFAAGEATGGLFGRDRIPSHSLTDALTGGLSAGKKAAQARRL